MIEAIRYPQKLFDAIDKHFESGNADSTANGLDRFVKNMRSYIVLKSVFGLIAAVSNTLLLWALGGDFALVRKVLSFLLSFLLNIGFVLALVAPTLLALLHFGVTKSVIVAVGFMAINTINDNVIKPRFVGESLNLSPAVAILSLVFWGWLLGPVGALHAVPPSIAVKFLFETFEDVLLLALLLSDQDAQLSWRLCHGSRIGTAARQSVYSQHRRNSASAPSLSPVCQAAVCPLKCF